MKNNDMIVFALLMSVDDKYGEHTSTINILAMGGFFIHLIDQMVR